MKFLRILFIAIAFFSVLTAQAFAQDSYFDHSLYAQVLAKFVRDGQVDYAALKNNPSSLKGYIMQVAELNKQAFDSMPGDEKIAFYINAYNAIILKVIVDYYPVKSIKEIPGVWNRIKFKVAGSNLTLNEIEHEILRKHFKEPRIHFSLVCASIGCPKLFNEPFSGKELDEQLNHQAYIFINDKTKVRLDKSNNILYLSSIFKWFGEDFGDVLAFVKRYLSQGEVKFIQDKKPKIMYIKYDWSLNDKL